VDEVTTKKSGMSTGMVIGIAVLVAIIFGGGAYALVNSRAEKDKKDLNTQITDLQSEVSNLKTVTATTTVTIPASSAVTAQSSTTATPKAGVTSKDQAVALVKNLQEIKDYLVKTPSGIIEFDHEDTANNAWVIHVYSMGTDQSFTFHWYSVNKSTGVVTKTL
jgi:hypothetical protein